MKLTKGKISRLYNKKRQSLKKHKKLNSSYKKRTFRNKRKVNLARKSLKRLHYRKHRGGEGDDDDTPKDGINETNQSMIEKDTTKLTENPNTTTSESVTDNTNTKSTSKTTEEKPDDTTDETTEKKPTDTEEVKGTTDKCNTGVLAVPIQPTEKITDTENVSDQETTEQPTDTSSLPPPKPPRNSIPPPTGITLDTTKPPTDTTDENTEEPTNTEEDTSNQPSQETTDTTEDVGDTSNTELINSFKTIANYIADVVVEKVSTSQSGDKPQEGFKAVNKAAETMASSGGSKFKKTRRFRLTNKNKTRHR
jgi:hypothetical protein